MLMNIVAIIVASHDPRCRRKSSMISVFDSSWPHISCNKHCFVPQRQSGCLLCNMLFLQAEIRLELLAWTLQPVALIATRAGSYF